MNPPCGGGWGGALLVDEPATIAVTTLDVGDPSRFDGADRVGIAVAGAHLGGEASLALNTSLQKEP
jgi:hypothetical protein